MFFNKLINEVTYDDVVNFCSLEIKENEVLDYKEDFPAKLEKVLSAFANTYGGLIIIGVKDIDGKPETKPKGISHKDGFEEKVQSIIMSNIKPPIFPLIHVCTPKQSNTFVLIQVPQSENTPHTIENNTKIYLRTGNITLPEKLVDIDNDLHWLINKRNDAKLLKENLVKQMTDYYLGLQKMHKFNINFAELNIYCIPLYPYKPFFAPKVLKDKLHDLSVSYQDDKFPGLFNSSIETLPNGVYLFMHNKNDFGEFIKFTALNNYGLVYHIEDKGSFVGENENKEKKLYLARVVANYVDMLRFYKNVQSKLQVNGDFELKLSISKLEGVSMYPIKLSNSFFNEPKTFSGSGYEYKETISTIDFSQKDKLIELTEKFIADIHWSLGLPREEAIIKKWLEERKINW